MHSIDDLIVTAWQSRREGRYDEAERGLREAIDASRQAGMQDHLIHAVAKLAHVMRDLGRGDEALTLSTEAVTLSRDRDPLLLAHNVRHLGDLHREARRLSEADRCYTEALALYRASEGADPLDVANALRPAALLKVAQGDRVQARELWSAARALYRKAGIQAGVDECTRRLAQLA